MRNEKKSIKRKFDKQEMECWKKVKLSNWSLLDSFLGMVNFCLILDISYAIPWYKIHKYKNEDVIEKENNFPFKNFYIFRSLIQRKYNKK